jgi:hypothetical protein
MEVTYRVGVAFGSLHMKQLHGFDELRNDQGIIRNRCAKTRTPVASNLSPGSYLSSRFLPPTKIIKRMENCKKMFFGRSDGEEDTHRDPFPFNTS